MNVFKLIYSDYRRYRILNNSNPIRIIFFTQGFFSILVYRLSHYVYFDFKIPVIKQFLLIILFLFQKLAEITTGIYLPYYCQVGKGLYIGHFGGIIINDRVVIGDNCNLSQNSTIGIKNGGKNPGVPKIGNRVYIGPNSVIIGGIEIGDDVAVGAGAIVTHSLPPRSIAAGNPAKIISSRGSFDYIHYDGMETDVERIESIKLAQD
jgi:serine O-acetyltransferase